MKTINTNIQLAFENLQDIANNPWFASILQSAVARFKENYVSEVEMANNAELKNLKEEHNFAIEAEKERLQKLKKQLKRLQSICGIHSWKPLRMPL